MTPGTYDLEVFRGRERTWVARMLQDTTTPVDLTGSTVLAAITLPAGKIELECVITDPTDGKVSLKIRDEQAVLLTGTFYSWTCTIIDSFGAPHPVLKGAVHVEVDDTL